MTRLYHGGTLVVGTSDRLWLTADREYAAEWAVHHEGDAYEFAVDFDERTSSI